MKLVSYHHNKERKLGAVQGGKIVYGLRGIKNVGSSAVDHIVEERKEGGAYKDMLEFLKRLGTRLVALTSSPASTLARNADIHLNLWVDREACPHNLAPTASTTVSRSLTHASKERSFACQSESPVPRSS